MPLILVLSFLLTGCASWHSLGKKKTKARSKSRYKLTDISGKYRAYREVLYKDRGSRVLTRLTIKDKLTNQELERASTLSSVKKGIVIPMVSQFNTWLDKKRYFSQIKYLKASNSYEVSVKSPEAKWNGVKRHNVPKGGYRCFLSQLPECIKENGILEKFKSDADLEVDIVVIWDNYPFYAEQYLGLAEKFYSIGSLRIDGLHGNMLRIALELQGQVLFYTYNDKFEFKNIYWVAQGYRLEKSTLKDGFK